MRGTKLVVKGLRAWGNSAVLGWYGAAAVRRGPFAQSPLARLRSRRTFCCVRTPARDLLNSIPVSFSLSRVSLRSRASLCSRALLCSLVVALLGAGSARAETSSDVASAPSPALSSAAPLSVASLAIPPPTFAYLPSPEVEVEGWRAFLEFEAVFVLGFVYYATSGNLGSSWDIRYEWQLFSQKLTGQSFGPDTNHFGTNFIGHPLGGTGYYLAARGNRLSMPQSLAFSVGGSLLWELFGEIRERLSMNDMIVTPFAGIAIGEPLTQLGAYFDRQPDSLRNWILGGVFAPTKRLSDTIDGAALRRRPDWNETLHARHQVVAALSDARHSAAGDTQPMASLSVSLSERLVRLPDYEAPGYHSFSFTDANVSSLALRAGFSRYGIWDAELTTESLLVGGYRRSARAVHPGTLLGTSVIGGYTMGFRYALHDYAPGRGAPLDRYAAVTPLGAAVEQRVQFAGMELRTDVNLGLDFGGITPVALQATDAEWQAAPPVLRDRGYYFATGVHARSSVELRTSYANWETMFETVLLTDVGGPGDPIHLPHSDSLTHLRTRLAVAVAPGYTLDFSGERRVRSSHLGATRARASEFTLGLGASLYF